MSDSSTSITGTPEVIASNIVIIVERVSSSTAPDLAQRLKSETLSSLLGRRSAITQGLIADPERGVVQSLQVEGTHGQKSVSVSSVRLEASDRTGKRDPDLNGLPALMAEIISLSGTIEIRAVGANIEIVFDSPTGQLASEAISSRLLDPSIDEEVGTRIVGMGTKIYVQEHSGHLSTVVIEPRFSDLETTEVWATINTNWKRLDVPTVEELRELCVEANATLDAFLKVMTR